MAAPKAMQGRSLVALARGEAPDGWREEVWIEHLMMEPSIRKHEGIQTAQFKYSRYFEADPVLEELYDLKADPLETVNLINSPQHRDVVRRLCRRMDELRDQYGGEFSARLWKETMP